MCVIHRDTKRQQSTVSLEASLVKVAYYVAEVVVVVDIALSQGLAGLCVEYDVSEIIRERFFS